MYKWRRDKYYTRGIPCKQTVISTVKTTHVRCVSRIITFREAYKHSGISFGTTSSSVRQNCSNNALDTAQVPEWASEAIEWRRSSSGYLKTFVCIWCRIRLQIANTLPGIDFVPQPPPLSSGRIKKNTTEKKNIKKTKNVINVVFIILLLLLSCTDRIMQNITRCIVWRRRRRWRRRRIQPFLPPIVQPTPRPPAVSARLGGPEPKTTAAATTCTVPRPHAFCLRSERAKLARATDDRCQKSPYDDVRALSKSCPSVRVRRTPRETVPPARQRPLVASVSVAAIKVAPHSQVHNSRCLTFFFFFRYLIYTFFEHRRYTI